MLVVMDVIGLRVDYCIAGRLYVSSYENPEWEFASEVVTDWNWTRAL
jgi:hypothetical protein